MGSFPPELNTAVLLSDPQDLKVARAKGSINSVEFDDRLLGVGGMNGIETFYGLVETTADALRIVELCRVGKLGRVSRRLHDKERQLIRSGSVFVFDELESGIKRWTDGRVWSPSRILGNFLIYRELERKSLSSGDPKQQSQQEQLIQDVDHDVKELLEQLESDPRRLAQLDDNELAGILPWLSEPILKEDEEDEQLEVLKSKKLLNNHKGRYIFKPAGLIKKTISIRIDGHPHHLICYYDKRDFCQGHLGQSSFNGDLMRELRRVRIPADLLAQQSFRKPTGLTVECAGTGFVPVMTTPQTFQPAPQGQAGSGKRRNSFPGAVPPKQLRSLSKTKVAPKPASIQQFVPIAPAIDSSFSDIFPSFASSSDFSSADLPPASSRPVQDDTDFILGLGNGEVPYNQHDTNQPNIYALDSYDQGCWQEWLQTTNLHGPSLIEQDRCGKNGRKSPFEEHDPMLPIMRPPSAFFQDE